MISTRCRLAEWPLLTASQAGFAIWSEAGVTLNSTFDGIAKVTVWQEDRITHDHVHAEIALVDGETLIVDEDMRGFRPLMDKLASMPGFDPDWWDKVILPPFAANSIVAYVRREPSETR
jgi:hypothetical protein